MQHPRRHSDGFDAGPLLFVLGVLVGLLGALVADRLAVSFFDRDIELVRSVRNLALDEFVAEVDSEELIDDALRGMVQGLDKYSRFYGPEEIAQLDRETYGEFRGIGVVFRRPTHEGQVLFPFPDSPASRAGVRVGDRFLAIDGAEVAAMGAGDLQASIQLADDDALEVRVLGLDGEERSLEIGLEQVIDPTVRHVRMLDDERGVGYIAIYSFSHRTPEEFDAAVSELTQRGLKALVVDLRTNPGGILDAAVRVANRFISSGTIVATRTRAETRITRAVPEEALLLDMPLVLLVDEGSASASEVLAGALQDHCAAALVGEPTYGKGTVQTLRRYSSDRAIVKLTTAKYFTPAWRQIERSDDGQPEAGIAPDFRVQIDDDERLAVYEFLQTYSPPPVHLDALTAWEEDEQAEVFSRPPLDRQLDTAVALLTGATIERDVSGAH